MAENSEQHILSQYDQHAALYGACTITMEDVARGIVRDLGLEPLSITSRLKEKDSLRDKLRRKDGNYEELEDVTDIAGVRITTYFADHVDKIAERIAQEFDVDWENSTDKREVLDPDRFGYLSWHHIVRLNANRAALPEYSPFRGLKVEIQTRSALQHAWAEIEHDLGYKSRLAVPKDFRRRLSRLAGLLELADQEFESIRDGLAEYERGVPEQIRRAPQLVEVDKASLFAFFVESPVVQEINEELASLSGSPLRTDHDSLNRMREYIEIDVAKLGFFQLETIQELDGQLRRYKEQILAFAQEWWKGHPTHGYFTPDASIFYLAFVLAGQTQDIQLIRRYVQVHMKGYPDVADTEREEVAARILETYNTISDQSS